ncbi:hypothetical protein [Rubellimicrobium roseum]|uniref:Uncharacterized protein n=1 Tax=Rubellimicrobium roseum TaxID=687525 RepID=A0A5C4N7T7_9RHOB|nr:hypothetical protein [Rubellimicrobium roseum]TNC63902.1 hypothetical protein FHG71_18950 [Rubellimicrobium roseum]
MRRLAPAAVLLSALALSACQTPRESCIAGASRELRTVDLLIRETQGNLNRGYAIETSQRIDVDREICEVELEDGTERRYWCEDTDVVDVQRPVAIDLATEQAKLDGLLERRAALAAERDARVQACVATYPE